MGYSMVYTKLDKLKQLQLAMVTWLDNKTYDKRKEANDTWKERMTYVLKCENRNLNKDDIKMLNKLWKHYDNTAPSSSG